MIFQNTPTLKAYLLKSGYDSLADLPSFDFDAEEFNRTLDEVRSQHPSHDDEESQSRAAYRILTHAQNSNAAAIDKPENKTAGTVLQVVDDLSRAIRQQIGVLAGKTSVVEHASTTMTEGLAAAQNERDKATKIIADKLTDLHAVAEAEFEAQSKGIELILSEAKRIEQERITFEKRAIKWAVVIIGVLFLILCGAIFAKAAPDPRIESLKAYPFIIASPTFGQMGSSYARVQFVSGGVFVNVSSTNPLPVTCLDGTCTGGGGGGGTSSTFGAAFPATGTAAGMSEGGNMVALTGDGSGRLQVACVTGCSGTTLGQALMAASLPVAIASNQSAIPVTGTFWQATQPVSGTFWQATQPVSGTVAANAGTNLNTSLLALEAGGNLASIKAKTDNIPALGQALAAASAPVVLTAAQLTTLTPTAAITNYANETGGNLATLAGAVSSSVVQSNTKQVNGVTTLAGAGAVGTGSQRVAVGQDATTIAGSAPGTAGTASPNVVTVQGAAAMTPILATVSDGAGALNVIVDSGTTTVTQATGTNLHAVIDSGAVTVSDGSGALNTIVDSGTLTAVTSITNTVTAQGTLTNDSATPSTNNLGVLPCLANTSAPTPTSGRLSTLSCLAANGAMRTDVTTLGGAAFTGNVGNATNGTIRVVLATDQPALTNALSVAQATASNLNATVVGATTPADGESNPTTAVSTESHLMGWNNSTWDRVYVESNGNDAEAVRTTGNLSTESHPMAFNGTTWDRARSANIGNNVPSTGLPIAVHYCQSNTTLPSVASTSYSAVQCDQFGRQIINDPKDDNIIAALTSLLQAQQNVRVRGTFGETIRSVNGALAVMPIQADPCSGIKQSIPISQTANTKYVVGVGRRTYVCSIFLVGADAEGISIVEGTGTTCGTGTLAVIGGATAAAGPNMAANGGFTLGNGMGTIAASNIPGNDICVFESASGRVAGVMTVAFGQ